MAKLDVYYKNKKVNEDIANLNDLEIEVAWENDGDEPVLRSGSLEFVGELAKKIHSHNDDGLVGGVGMFEAPQLRLEACESGIILFNGGINTADCTTSYECDKIVAPLRYDQIDYFRDRASSFGFAYLASLPFGNPAKINISDYINVPYVINTIPDGFNIMVSAISLFVMLKEFEEILEKTVAVIAEVSGDAGVAAGALANAPFPSPVLATAMVVGRVVVDILRITFYVLYLLFIIKAIIVLIQMLFDNIIQPLKYKKGMRVGTLMEKGCTHLGLTFFSSLYQGSGANRNDVIIPHKSALNNFPTKTQDLFGKKFIKNKDYDDAKNPNSVGYIDWTFQQLIEAEELRLNAEARVSNNVLYFEHKDFFKGNANYTLPNIQRHNADPHGTNACELVSTYRVAYTLDEQDTNTYDQYEGTSCQMTLQPNVVNVKKNVLLKNITEIILPYAIVKRKENLTAVEEIFETAYDVVATIYNGIVSFFNAVKTAINAVIGVINAIPGIPNINFTIPLTPPMPPNPFAGRIGAMLLSSDFVGIPKILVVDASNKVHPNNATLTAARTLIDTHHYTNFAIRTTDSFGNVRNDHNQWFTYENKEIPLCCGDYIRLRDNNYFKTYDQKQAKLISLVWNPHKERAKITYRVKQKYTNNLSNTYIIDGQQ